MNGFKFVLFSLALVLTSGSCARQAKILKEGEALYLMYRTSFTQNQDIALWLSPAELLPLIAPSEKIFIENLHPDTLIFQINQEAYIRDISYNAGGKELLLNLTARLKGNAVSVQGHLIFIRRSEADKLILFLDNIPLINTNLPPRK